MDDTSSSNPFHVLVSSCPGHEKVIAEIYYGDHFVA
ncbi:hypothetical protein HOV93_03950 [Planctomycetes bacterium FF15]|uniref:Uncharacterized protein n=1 Tax=Bremerella alba TaxID=980252 RepID=A0A7V8V1U0_9BACT|nr:hypothetical protein [Bremerella alba]